MTHTALVTFDVAEDGTQTTVNITCNACNGGCYTVATAHLATLTNALLGICAALHLDLSRPAAIIALDSAEDRRTAEATYAETIRNFDVEKGVLVVALHLGLEPNVSALLRGLLSMAG